MRTYARKVRSDARWSRATDPVFRNVSERLKGTCCAPSAAPAAATAGTTESSRFGGREVEQQGEGDGAGGTGPTSRLRPRWKWAWAWSLAFKLAPAVR